MDKIFEKSFRFHVQEYTKGKVKNLGFSNSLQVLKTFDNFCRKTVH